MSIYREIQELCAFEGAKDKELWRIEHLSTLMEKFPQLSMQEWEWVFDCAQRAMFSNERMSMEEKQNMYHLYLQLRKKILVNLTWGKKIWFLYGRVL